VAEPYYADDQVTLYLGDMRQVLPALDVAADCVVADPPYGETSLAWDRWPDGWPDALLDVSRSMWCFGSMRMFLDRRDEFAAWRLSQDIVWEKPNGSGFAADRFKRVHEHVTHWYRGNWRDIHHDTPRVQVAHRTKSKASAGAVRAAHTGQIGSATTWDDDGTRLTRSVIPAASMWRRGAIHPTEKPVEILSPLIEYACPSGGLILDPFAGSGSTAVAARLTGRRAVLIEADERYCKAIARRLAQDVLPLSLPTEVPREPWALQAAEPDHLDDCLVCECGARGPHEETPHCYQFETDCPPDCPNAVFRLAQDVLPIGLGTP
jgi:site-specific DNA-methyltransferase (adenine-specific)